MNSSLKYKLLQNLSKKRANGGFTLIELLVVVIIVGILAAVALPNLLGQLGKARETEGKNAVGSINRAAQAVHFESRSFENAGGLTTQDASALGTTDNLAAPVNPLGVAIESEYYFFTTEGSETDFGVTAQASNGESTSPAVDTQVGVNIGIRTFYGGAVFTGGVYNSGVCQSDLVGEDVSSSAVDFTTPSEPACAGTDVLLE